MLKYWNARRQPARRSWATRSYPYVITTYRLTEHYLSGAMSRWLPWLAELQPELFVEISPELAAEKGIAQPRLGAGQHAARRDPRQGAGDRPHAAVHASTARRSTRSACPGTGATGLVTGDVVNDLTALVGDPNVTIHEGKAFVCNVEKAQGSSTMAEADGLLHRHHRLHRLQGVRGRLQGVEPAAGRPTAAQQHAERRQLRQHAPARRRCTGGTSSSSSSSPRTASDGRWLHDERRLQALRPGRLPGGLPDRRDHPHRVRHGRHPVGRLQRLPRLHRRLPVRRDRHQPGLATPRRSARSATTGCRRAGAGLRQGLPDRLDPVRPDRRAAASGPSTRVAAAPRGAARSARTSTAPTRRCSAGSTPSTCWWTGRRSTACRPSPSCPAATCCPSSLFSVLGAVVVGAHRPGQFPPAAAPDEREAERP